jgi:two-component system, chemotaxis family, CheB/CheR fusion protein
MATDLLTGSDWSLSLFYVFPGAWVAWRLGMKPGLFAAFTATVGWLVIELSWGRKYSNSLVPYCNFGSQLFATSAAAWLVARVAAQSENLRREIAARRETESALASSNELLEQRVAERSAAARQRAEDLSRSEAALRARKNLFGSIMGCMAEGVLVIDVNGFVRLANPAARRLLNLADSDFEVDGGILRQDVSLDDILRGRGCAPPAGGSLAWAAEVFFPDSAGGVWFLMTSRPLVGDGGAAGGVVVVFTDVSLRKELERVEADVAERERQRIGRELHDGLGQHLVSTAFAAKMLADRLEAQRAAETAEASEICGLVNDAITQVRQLARTLYPVRLADGLPLALAELAESVRRTTGIVCRTEIRGDVRVPDPAAAANLYRLAQEAVNNAVKHAKPTNIAIRFERTGRRLVLTISNDGRRFESTRTDGLGLEIMRTRARAVGGAVYIDPGEIDGTVVRCEAPAPPDLDEGSDDAED